MAFSPIGDYQPGATVLHRLPVGAKLLSLVVLSVASVVFRGVPTTAGLLVFALAMCVVAPRRSSLSSADLASTPCSSLIPAPKRMRPP